MSYRVVYQDIGVKDYKETWNYQEEIFRKLVGKKSTKDPKGRPDDPYEPGVLLFVEHPHVFTLGKSGSEKNLLIDNIRLKKSNAQFYRTDRGGDITYHGPGQIVGYPIFDLEILGIGLKEYVYRLEESVIATISDFGIKGSRLDGAAGVWLNTGGRTSKICAIGVKASRYVTMHGFAFNVNTDLTFFNYINPCGFTDKGVTSLRNETGVRQDLENVKLLLKRNLGIIFNIMWV